MKKVSVVEASFETAFKALSLATWNRPRTSTEINSFLARREAIVEHVEL